MQDNCYFFGGASDERAQGGDLYWQISLKHRYSPGRPALRELYPLATVIDRVRGGQLLEALDALAGRFIAVNAATHDGWNIAKQLEVAVPADQAIAPAELQLAARRHYNMISKAQGYEGKGAWRSTGGGRGWGNFGGGREESKGWWRRKGGKESKDGGRGKLRQALEGRKRRRQRQVESKGRDGGREGRCLEEQEICKVRTQKSELTSSTMSLMGVSGTTEEVQREVQKECPSQVPGAPVEATRIQVEDCGQERLAPFSDSRGLRDEDTEKREAEVLEEGGVHAPNDREERVRICGEAEEKKDEKREEKRELLRDGGVRGEKIAEVLCKRALGWPGAG